MALRAHDLRQRFSGRADWAVLVYDDLCQVKQWSDVDVVEVAGLDQLLILGVPFGAAVKKLVVPWPSSKAVTPRQIGTILDAIADKFQDIQSFTIAFTSPDSTITYFMIHRDLIATEPVPKSTNTNSSIKNPSLKTS